MRLQAPTKLDIVEIMSEHLIKKLKISKIPNEIKKSVKSITRDCIVNTGAHDEIVSYICILLCMYI